MHFTQELKAGEIYYLKDYTAPKVFNGLFFECLLTEQRIASHSEVRKATGISIENWAKEIFRRERFFNK